MFPTIINYWREIVLAVLALTIYLVMSSAEHKIATRDGQIETLRAEVTLNDLQKEALRKAILDQNEAVEKERIDAEKRAAHFESESKRINEKYQKAKDQIASLSGDAECQAMREAIREAVK